MDPHYTNNYTDSYQGIIPSSNPQESQPQQDGHFNTLMSNVLNTGGFDGNHLYSDLDAIEAPLDNNMTNMELLDNLMTIQNNMFPPNTINQGIFNFDDPKLFNSNLNNAIGQNNADGHNTTNLNSTIGHNDNSVIVHNNSTIGHNNAIGANNSGHNSLGDIHSPTLSDQEIQSNLNKQVLQQTNKLLQVDGVLNKGSVIHSLADLSPPVSASLLNPMPAQSFYSPSPVQTVQPSPDENSVQDAIQSDKQTPPNSTEESLPTNGASSDLNLHRPTEDQESDVEPQEPTEDPLANDDEAPANGGTDDEETNGNREADVEANGNENVPEEEEEKTLLETCVREGCEKIAVMNPEWEDEYCSNECCVKHCKTVFNNWVQENMQNAAAAPVEI